MKINRARNKTKRIGAFGKVRNVAVLMCVFAAAIFVYFYLHKQIMKPFFSVKRVAFTGNNHLTDDELRTLACIRLRSSLVSLSSKDVSRQLLKSPWVRSVSLRREFPDTVSIAIKEAEPFALLDTGGHLFLIDENGKLLEELKDDAVPFLPVIASDPFKEKEGFSEALNLVRLMNAKGFAPERDSLEIVAHTAHDLSVRMDDLVVKMGAGGYEEKIDRLIQLDEKIKKMGISVDYIDLRFEGRAIVKPVANEAPK